MLSIYKIALGPVLIAQARRLRRTALRLPEPAGPRYGHIHASGSHPLRVLIVGDSSAAGVGVAHQTQALAPQVARELAARLSRPVQWQLVARSGVNSAEAIELVRGAALLPADVVVTALGTNDVTAQIGRARFRRNYERLLALVRERTGAVGAVLTGLPPLHILPAAPQPLRWYLGRCARQLDAIVRSICEQAQELRYVSLQWAAQPEKMARDKFHPGLEQYAVWAGMVATEIVALARSNPAGPLPLWPATHA